jgi:hypothetical protein
MFMLKDMDIRIPDFVSTAKKCLDSVKKIMERKKERK